MTKVNSDIRHGGGWVVSRYWAVVYPTPRLWQLMKKWLLEGCSWNDVYSGQKFVRDMTLHSWETEMPHARHCTRHWGLSMSKTTKSLLSKSLTSSRKDRKGTGWYEELRGVSRWVLYVCLYQVKQGRASRGTREREDIHSAWSEIQSNCRYLEEFCLSPWVLFLTEHNTI